MPSTGTPIASSAGSAAGASVSYTELGPPERIRPRGASARICSIGAVQGRTTEKTLNSRMRRAISWVYCEPKSRMTMVEVSTVSIVNGVRRGTRLGPQTSAWRPVPGAAEDVADFFDHLTVSYTHLRAHETVLDLVCR